jgi:hypothetical protein
LEISGARAHQGRVFSEIKVWMRIAGMLLLAGMPLRAQTVDLPPVPHVLVYSNGDRVQGRLLAREGDMLVFRAVNFGDLRVPAKDVRVLTAPVAVRKALAVASGPTGEGATEDSEGSPVGLAYYLKEVFGSWHGRLVLSSQLTSDTNERSDYLGEASLKRKWTDDEVNLTGRYEFSKTNNAVTKDVLRSNGLWRHTFPPTRYFTAYRPALEWNRESKVGGTSSDYLLLQQEFGVGVSVVKTEDWTVRTGVAENLFDNWQIDSNTHQTIQTESVFVEADLKLPWRIVMTERGVWYISVLRGSEGWEHQFEVTKKFTDTLSLGMRQEVRRNDPDVRSEDYSLLRFFLGFDF